MMHVMKRAPNQSTASERSRMNDERVALMNSDPGDWEDPTVGMPVENPRLQLAIVLDYQESLAIGKAARAANLPMHEYIKQVALTAARDGTQD